MLEEQEARARAGYCATSGTALRFTVFPVLVFIAAVRDCAQWLTWSGDLTAWLIDLWQYRPWPVKEHPSQQELRFETALQSDPTRVVHSKVVRRTGRSTNLYRRPLLSPDVPLRDPLAHVLHDFRSPPSVHKHNIAQPGERSLVLIVELQQRNPLLLSAGLEPRLFGGRLDALDLLCTQTGVGAEDGVQLGASLGSWIHSELENS